jgi:hypothetical protein
VPARHQSDKELFFRFKSYSGFLAELLQRSIKIFSRINVWVALSYMPLLQPFHIQTSMVRVW